MRYLLVVAVLSAVICSSSVLAADRWNEPGSFGFVPLVATAPNAMVVPYVNWHDQMYFDKGTARLELVSWMCDSNGQTVPPDKDIEAGTYAFEVVPVPGVDQQLFFFGGVQGIKFLSTVPVANITVRIVEKKIGQVTRVWQRTFKVHFFSPVRKGPFRPFADITPLL